MNTMDFVAKGDYAVLRMSPSNNKHRPEPVIEQFPSHVTKHEWKHTPIEISMMDSSNGYAEVIKKTDRQPLVLEMAVQVNRPVNGRKKLKNEQTEILFYRQPFALAWIDALIALFQQLPAEQYHINIQIDFNNIKEKRSHDKNKDDSNNAIKGCSAMDAFADFMKQHPIKLDADQMKAIAPQWCHIVMSSAVPAEVSKNPHNICCAPQGMNRAMWVPEKMLAKLSEHLSNVYEHVYVTVNYELFTGTSILKSMEYKIHTETQLEISVMYDHPFRAPHFKYDNEGIAHLEAVLGEKLTASHAEHAFGA